MRSMDSTEQILEFLFDTPPEGAVDYLKSQGYEVSANSDEIINAIKNHAFTVAKVATADKLQKIHNELKKAMDAGTPYKEWLKSVKDTVPGKTNWQTVYRTNMSSAYNSGRYVQQLAATEYAPFWQHFCPIDSRTRPLGHTLNGLIYRFDDPHWSTMYPPNEYNDRDRIGVLSEFAMQQQGLKAESEPPRDKDGKLYEPAKGFKGNPATSTWKPDLTKYSPDIRSELEKALGGKEIKPTEGLLKAEKVVKEFKPAKTVEEAKQWAEKNLGITHNTSKVSNVESLNIINKRLFELTSKYKNTLNTFGIEFKMGAAASADATTMNFNSKLFDDLNKFKEVLDGDQKMLFHPKGCNTPESIIDHEFAHVVTKKYIDKPSLLGYEEGATFIKELTRIKSAYSKQINKSFRGNYPTGASDEVKSEFYHSVPDYISGYAKTHTHELVAESFAMVLNSKTPSKFALQIFDLINKYFGVE